MSHLYGFHPGDQISIDEQPEIFQAVRKTLDYRLDNGGAGTGWSGPTHQLLCTIDGWRDGP